MIFFFFINTPPTDIYTLSLHDALPISRPGANISQNHEGSRAMFPAFAHVRAARTFAHGMQIERPHQALQVVETLSAKELHAQPGGPWMNLWRRHRWHHGIGQDVKGGGHGVLMNFLFYAYLKQATNRRAECDNDSVSLNLSP